MWRIEKKMEIMERRKIALLMSFLRHGQLHECKTEARKYLCSCKWASIIPGRLLSSIACVRFIGQSKIRKSYTKFNPQQFRDSTSSCFSTNKSTLSRFFSTVELSQTSKSSTAKFACQGFSVRHQKGNLTLSRVFSIAKMKHFWGVKEYQ